MEDLFGYNNNKDNKNDSAAKRNQAAYEAPKFVQIIDPKKSHNLSILLKAINVTTEEVCDAIQEGNLFPLDLLSTKKKIFISMRNLATFTNYESDHLNFSWTQNKPGVHHYPYFSSTCPSFERNERDSPFDFTGG